VQLAARDFKIGHTLPRLPAARTRARMLAPALAKIAPTRSPHAKPRLTRLVYTSADAAKNSYEKSEAS